MARILVVDDDRRVREDLGKVLGRLGHEVLTAYDGEEGFEAALRVQPDLVITDMVMPYMDGGEMLARLRATGFTRPIIFFYAGVTPAERTVLLRSGADEVIGKGDAPSVLLAAIARQLAKRGAGEAGTEGAQ